MKKVISIIATVLFLVAIYVPNIPKTQKLEIPVATKTQELPNILTDAELSKLYTCKQDVRKQNPDEIEVDSIYVPLLLGIARAESGPTLEGQLWAIRTIFNRIENGNFGNNVYEVISYPGQFEVFTKGTYLKAEVNANTHIALAMVEGGWDETEGALYWRSDKDSEDSWHENNLTFIKEVEGNRYYK